MLYIMRHGATDWNKNRRLQGRTDIPLNTEGRQMAARAAAEYADVHFDICYCSPLSRAKETAEIVLKNRNIPIICDERLVEMSFGAYEGAQDSFPAAEGPMAAFFNRPESYIPPEGAESFFELYERTGEFLEKVAKPLVGSGKDVIIVGHGAMNASIICRIKGIPLKDFWSVGLDSCKLIKLL